MGGFFGAISTEDVISDVYYGTDYHSHLGTRRGGIAAFSTDVGLQREIHNIENSPFRTKFSNIHNEMHGASAIGIISDYDPQPIMLRSKLGTYAMVMIGKIQNTQELIDEYLAETGGYFDAMSGSKINATELTAALINQKGTFEEGIKYAQSKIDGTVSLLILRDNGNIIAARDRLGRLPVLVGKRDDGYSVSFESYAQQKLGYELYKELGPGEIVEINLDGVTVLAEAGEEMRICSFLWSYYGYPTSSYEGVNVEMMRYKNGNIMADFDKEIGSAEGVDYVGGVPDSGTPHAIGYANASDIPFARPLIKYTPTWSRSFMPTVQNERNKVAKMKQIPVHELIEGKKLLFVDDSIVRGTQMKETVDFLFENGAEEVHMRSACPPIMFGCKYLNFSRSNSEMELIARRQMYELEGEEAAKYIDEYLDPKSERGMKMREGIRKELNVTSVEFQSLEGVIEAIGLEPCKLCTYCWNGKE
ncbi:MAG: amidophosphoribosyltransferase [Eubacterium sp.]|nr:amidophosphoribosyltransferase [Candidatus Colimonas fimequi]